MVLSPKKTSISKGKELVLYAISYIRVSTQRQSELDKSGIRRQLQAYITWLENHPEYKNLDGLELRDLGVSGRKNIEKGALGLFIKKAEKGEIPPNSCLVVESMSRLTRLQPYDGMKLIMRIWDLGHKIAFTQGRWKGEILTGREPGIIERVASALEAASYEWEEKRERIVGWFKDTSTQMEQGDLSFFKPRKKGKKTNYPFWLDFDENTNSFFEIKVKADLVRRIFKMAQTMGYKKIAYILEQEGIKNPVEWGKKRTKYLTSRVIDETILRHRGVLGERNHLGVIKKDVYPAIITPEEYDEVQAAIQKRRLNASMAAPKRHVVNLFQGVSYCSHCGGRLVVVRKKSFVNMERRVQNSPKIEREFQTIVCDRARENKGKCPATNSAPYRQEHNDLDNELKILNKIASFRWAEYFTDEKHEQELKVLTDLRMKKLNERNQIEQKLDNLKNSRQRCWEENEPVPNELKELIKAKQDEYDQAHTGYERSKLDIQNLKRKKTGQQLEVDIQKRVNTFIQKERFIPAKRAEFNMFLREYGIALEAAIFKKQKAANVPEENYKFDIGIGMYDHINGKYIGLNQVEEDAVVLGLDLKQVREDMARREAQYKEMSLEEGRDIRRPIEKKKKQKITAEERKAYEELVHSRGGKTLKDLLKEQGDL